MIRGGGVVAQRQLLAHVEKELGVAVAAENEIGKQHRGGIVGTGTEAERKLALRHVHLFRKESRRFGRGAALRADGGDDLPACKRGKGTLERALHAVGRGAAAVKHLNVSAFQKPAVKRVERLIADLFHALLRAEPFRAVALKRAHFL